MKKIIIKILAAATLLLVFTGCVTTYSARRGYVGFSTDDVKSSQQSMKTSLTDEEVFSTYDDEFVYDEDGDVIKHIQTQYFDNGNKYDEYVVVYQKIDGTILPKSVSINGIVYMEVEYEILSSDHEGRISEYTSTPKIRQEKQIMFSRIPINWDIDIDNFDVPFRSDDHFVSTEEKYAFYTGLSLDKVLTIGYNNIVLKSFYHSPTKYNAGYNISLSNSTSSNGDSPEFFENFTYSTTFTYDWDVIAGKIVQTGMELKESNFGDLVTFEIEREFDDLGRRITELWKIDDSTLKNDEPIKK